MSSSHSVGFKQYEQQYSEYFQMNSSLLLFRNNEESFQGNLLNQYLQESEMKNKENLIDTKADTKKNNPKVQLKEEQKKCIFRQQNPKKSKKNQNFPKFLFNYFKQIFQEEIQTLQYCLEDGDWIQRNTQKLQEIQKYPYIVLEDLKLLFGEDEQENKDAQKNRKLLMKCLSSEVIARKVKDDRHIRNHNRFQYLLKSKIYRIRCCSKKLVLRVQSR